ncbi:MAG: hypothetical protein ACP5VQ_01580 [Phycisphaerae bacterium]
MIYDFPDAQSPIRQGDIFLRLPRVDISMETIPVLGEDNSPRQVTWSEIAENEQPTTVIAAIRSVAAIVATQDCDAMRAADITLCEIGPFIEVYPGAKNAKNEKGWISIITQHARANLKWFYLPPDRKLGFDEKMAVNFMATLRLNREELERIRNQRVGRLNDEAEAHFRERISEFFRRYPYDEWYALTKDEFAAYASNYPEASPRPWQT